MSAVPAGTPERDEVLEILRRIEPWIRSVDKRLDGVEKRLDGVETHLDSVEKRLDGVEKRLDGVEDHSRKAALELAELKGQAKLQMNWWQGLLFVCSILVLAFTLLKFSATG